ncbi:MAG: LacI family DNA-binding transcriptional regulator [Lachnospiraceae bacterium]
MPAIKDVAKLANVSVGTVSRYLHNPENLTPAYRARVRAAIEELHYQPSRLAQSLRTKKTNMIALVVPELLNQFYIELYNSIRTACYQHGYIPIMYTMESGRDMLQHLFAGNGATQIDGMILAFMDDAESLALIRQISGETPYIFMSSQTSAAVSYSHILSDTYTGAYDAACHLISLGHTRIACIGHEDNHLNMDEKLNGIRKAFREHSIDFDSAYYASGPSTYATGYHAASRFMRMEVPPTAIFAGNDMIAVGVLKYLAEYQHRVPQDVAVVGFDGIQLSTICTPALTTVVQPIEAMGTAAVKSLLGRIAREEKARTQIVFKPTLAVRQSTDAGAPTVLEI